MIKKAGKFIRDGKLVAFPTETVYGLGADATNNDACLKIFAAKKRPANNPLIIHVTTLEQAQNIGEFSKTAKRIAQAFWPGPISIVLPLKVNSGIAPAALAGLNTVALRVPAYQIALDFINEAGRPIAAPSANPSNYISPTNINHVRSHFIDNPEIFILSLDDYQSSYGLESTIIDTSTPYPIILREGSITAEIISQELKDIKIAPSTSSTAIKSPGMFFRHYAPITPIRLNACYLEKEEIALNFGNSNLCLRAQNTAVSFSLNLSPTGDLAQAATNLYSYLRMLDDYAITHHVCSIAVATIPRIGVGVAINDRLNRAAA